MSSDLTLQAKILIIDDELPNVRLLEKILERAGYLNVSMTTDSRHAIPMFVDDQPDLVLLDLHMPHLSGYEVLSSFATLQDPRVPVPIIVLTADTTSKAKHRALSSGAADFVFKPYDNTEVTLRIKNALQMRFLQRKLENRKKMLDEQVHERTELLQSTLDKLRRSQQQVVQQERLRALGMMATGIAHDFNNVLSLVMGYGELLLQECGHWDENSKKARYLQHVLTAARDGAEMVDRLSRFQRPSAAGDLRQSVSLNRLIHQAIELTAPKWREEARAKGITIEVRPDLEGESYIMADSGEIRELLTNMIFNAVDAMPKGGTLTIRSSEDKDNVLLDIQDTGQGMSAAVRDRCLEPFFTTKGDRGSGLGLAIIYGIIQRHEGTLEIESEENVGTRFLVCLPRAAAPAQAEIKAAPLPNDALNILVVDDQPVMGEILAEYLTTDCHTVACAADANTAIELFREQAFDLVITDKAMPGMSGEQLAAALREIRDNVPVILLTGFAESGISKPDSPIIDVVLGKPVNAMTLRQAVARAVTLRGPGITPPEPDEAEPETTLAAAEIAPGASVG